MKVINVFLLSKKIVLLCLCIFLIDSLRAEPFPRLERKVVQEIIKWVNHNEFAKALQSSRELIEKKDPDHLEIYVLRSFVLMNYLNIYKTFVYRNEFLDVYQKGVRLANALLKIFPQNAYLHFYLGALHGYHSMLLVKEGNLIKALGKSKKIVTHLKKAIEYGPVYDAYYGLSQYHYYKSYFSRFFEWIPGVKNDRAISYAYLDTVKKKGIYMKYEAHLSWYTMKILDREIDDLELLLSVEKKKNPNNLFLYHKFFSLYEMEKAWEKLPGYCFDALRIYDKDLHSGHSAYLLVYYYLTVSLFHLRQFDYAKHALNRFEYHGKNLYDWNEDKEYLKKMKKYKKKLSSAQR